MPYPDMTEAGRPRSVSGVYPPRVHPPHPPCYSRWLRRTADHGEYSMALPPREGQTGPSVYDLGPVCLVLGLDLVLTSSRLV